MVDDPEAAESALNPDAVLDAPEPQATEPVEPPHRSRLRIAVVLTLIAAIVVVGAIGGNILLRPDPAVGAPIPSPRGPIRLVVVDPAGRLATMNDLGESVIPLGGDGIAHEFPAWSPDATRIASIGHGEDGHGVFVASTAGGDPIPIYLSRDRPPFYLSWSPDGANVSFLTSEPGGMIGLRVAPADGSSADTVLRRGAPMYWDWADAERVMVHAGGTHEDAFLGEIGLDAESQAAGELAPGFFRPPVVGRDGRYRAYVSPAGDGAAIVVEQRGGSERLAVPSTGSVAMAFDPTGRFVAYTSLGKPTSEPPALPIGPLRLINAVTGEDSLLLDRPIIAFYWSPDGRTIATLELLPATEPGVDIASAGVLPAAAQPPGVTVNVAFVDVMTDEVRSEQPVRVSDLYAFQILPYFDQYGLSHRTWSADSVAISLPIVDVDGRSLVVVIRADGGPPTPAAEGAIGFWSP